MLSPSTDYTPIATWEWASRTYVIQVASIQERPVSVFIAADGRDCDSAGAMIPTDKSLGELIGFWNRDSMEFRTRFANEALEN
jgi:hypothetical protein